METILLIDDQNIYLKSLELALKKHYVILFATNMREAIEVLKAKNCDIALIDIRLDENDKNNMDGLKILEWIRMNKVNIVSFVMSAYQEFSYAEQALNLGARHFFKKPIDVISLIAILKEKS